MDRKIKKEIADLAESDYIVLEEISEWMRSFVSEVNACGRDGELELRKVRELAPKGLKILANYI